MCIFFYQSYQWYHHMDFPIVRTSSLFASNSIQFRWIRALHLGVIYLDTFVTPSPTLGPRNRGHTMEVWDHDRLGQYGSRTLVRCSKNKGARADHLDILMFHTFSWALTKIRKLRSEAPPLLQQSSTIFRAGKLTGKLWILYTAWATCSQTRKPRVWWDRKCQCFRSAMPEPLIFCWNTPGSRSPNI